MIDYPASSSIAKEGVLIVYYKAVKMRGMILILRTEHEIPAQ
jgi:hypothetical protein